MSLELSRPMEFRCTLRRQDECTLVWRPETALAAGAGVELRAQRLRAFTSWRFVSIAMPAGEILYRWKPRPTVSEMWANPERSVLRARLPRGAKKGEPVEFNLTVVPPVWAGIDCVLSVWTATTALAGDKAWEPVREAGSECVLAAVPGPVERLSVYSRPAPDSTGRVRTVIVPEDRFGNPGRFEHQVQAELAWNGAVQALSLREPATVWLPAPAGGIGRAVVSIPMRALGPAENIANGRRNGGQLMVTGNPVWSRDCCPKDSLPAFGEFHWHTDYSNDGQRPLRQALLYARDLLNADFAAPGDHNPRGRAWDETVATLEEFNRADAFATFFGWENGTAHGHENYYFTDPAHPLVCGGAAGITGGRPDELAARLRELHATSDFIAVPHHTNCVSEARRLEDNSPFWHPYPWGPPEAYLRLVEVFQTRGNQERNSYEDAWRGWHQHNGASVQDALALGHRIGFAGGTDNHCGWPGRAFGECEGLGIHPPKSVILTGIWTPRVERHAVFAALKAGHSWAVWDTRALVAFSVNNVAAGDELQVRPGEPLVARLRLSAEDALQTMEIISAGRIVWQASSEQLDIGLEIPLGTAAASPTHFYFRALQRDGGLIYASPVFVGISPATH